MVLEKDLGLVHDQVFEWEVYIKKLNVVGYRRSREKDTLIWYANPMTGCIIAKFAYQAMVKNSSSIIHKWWYKTL